MAQFRKRMMTGFADGAEWRQFMSDLYDDLGALKLLANDLRTKYNEAVTLINELKADHNAHLAAASMHYNGTASVTDTTNTVSATNATTTAIPGVTLKTTGVE